MCVGMAMPWQTYGGQRTTHRSWSSALTVWVLEKCPPQTCSCTLGLWLVALLVWWWWGCRRTLRGQRIAGGSGHWGWLWCALLASWLPLCCCSTTDSPWELFLHKSLLQRQQKGNQYTDWSMSPRFIKRSESPVWPMLLIVCMILALLHGINLRLSMELWIGLELMSQ